MCGQVSELCGQRTVFVDASLASVAVAANGTVYLWGAGESLVPVPLERSDLQQIALGNAMYGLTEDSKIWVKALGVLDAENAMAHEIDSGSVTQLSAAGNILMGVAPGDAYEEEKQNSEQADCSMHNVESVAEEELQQKRVSFSEMVETAIATVRVSSPVRAL